MKIGILGVGYWGPNIIRNFLGNKDVKSITACDLNISRLHFAKQKFPEIDIIHDFNEFMNNNVFDIIVIATPVDTHYNIAKLALEKNANIWVEKPFTSNSEQAMELIEIAEKKSLKIFVDHTFIYTGAVRKIKELVGKKELGEVIYFDSVRINLGLFQNDVNVIWDLAPHDFSIMNYVIDKKVTGVTANGIANYYGHENLAHISVYFNDNCFAHFHLNWTSPVKIRRTIIGGTKKMLVFDDMENFEKLKIYDSGIELNEKQGIYEALVQYRIGDMYSPKVTQTEALSLAVSEFISSIKENRKPLTGGDDGLKVVKILEAAELSIKQKGKFININ
jgi:predicted dehydrogenase